MVTGVVTIVRRGLIVIGASAVGMDDRLSWTVRNENSRFHRLNVQLPQGHPERLATHVPLSDEERRLWSQLLK